MEQTRDQVISRFAGSDNPLAVPVAAIIGVPIYIRADTMIPIGLALVIGGAGASIPELTL